jgi:hypothetical protein
MKDILKAILITLVITGMVCLVVWKFSYVPEQERVKILRLESHTLCERNNLTYYESQGWIYCVKFSGDIMEERYIVKGDNGNHYLEEIKT